MLKIKFGTDGWRAIMADDYTIDSAGESPRHFHLDEEKNMSKAIIGYDTRFGAPYLLKLSQICWPEMVIMSIYLTIVPRHQWFLLVCCTFRADLGIVLTIQSSLYNGYKLKHPMVVQ
ncbi:MAG: hypothetical protein IPP42_02780 [Saprospiraceae bacterium]|nr:hypothetical protein [Saprospiraceae bacterium]